MKIIFPLSTVRAGGLYHTFLLNLLLYPSTEQNIVNQDAKELIISDYHFWVECQMMGIENPIEKLKEICDTINNTNQSIYPTIKEIPLWIKADIGILDMEYKDGITYRQWSTSDYPDVPFATNPNSNECIIRIPNWENCDKTLFEELYLKQGGEYNMVLLTTFQMQSLTVTWI